MSKKAKQKWISFKEDGIRYMECKVCQSEYVSCDEDIVAVTCSNCIVKIDMIKFPNTIKKQKVSSGRPAGWHFMNEYVDKDGNVFHKGKEQPELKGTLKPTKVKPRKKRKKLTADQKLFKRVSDYKKRKRARRKK